MTDQHTHDLVVVANRLPVDKFTRPDGEVEWRPSPGGLVSAMEPVMKGREGAWVGWTGEAGKHPPEPFEAGDMWLRPVALSATEVEDHYEGFSNDTLWPIYHDVIVPASFRRRWYDGYRRVNHRFAEIAASVAARGATVWVHDYQLQLVPAMLRTLRPDVRIGWFNHIPFPPVELFAQIPWRRELVEGLLGADLLGFQRTADAQNFLRVVRRLLDLPVRGDQVLVTTPGGTAPVGPRRGVPDLGRRHGAGGAGPAARGRGAGPADPGRPRRPAAHPAGRGPAGLHQGHPAPAQGVPGAARRRRAQARPTPCSCRWPRRAASGSTPTASCATRSR